MSKFLKSARSGYVLVFLAFLLPIIVASIYFAINFTERTSIYSHKDCSADAALTAIKNYNFGAPFEAQKLGLLSKADNVYNDKAVMHSDSAIKHEELIVTPNCFSIVPTDSNITEFNQFVGLYSSIDMSYRLGFFYDENYIKNAKYLASECKLLDASIPNTGINLACNCVLPAEKGFNGYCNSYAYNEEHNNGMKFTFNKNSNTTSKTINLSKRVADTDKLTIQKDGDSLVVNIKDDLSGKTYSAKAIPAKCNVDIVMCIPTNGATCNENNLDLASVKTGDSTGLPLKVETTETSPSVNVQNTSIYQISQACKKFIKDNFMATQGVCAGIVPYSGKLSIPHYRFESWGEYQVHFDSTYYMLYANQQNVLLTKIMGYYLYGSCGDPTKVLHYGNVEDSTYGGLAKGVLNTWHKYGANIRHQRGLLSSNPRNDQNYDYDVDVSAIPTNRPEFDTGYLLSSLYPAYLGYANVLRGKADEGSIDYLPNPYYVIELTPDMVKICDLLECFRPINDEYSCSNFLFLPFYWSNALLNYPWSDDPVRQSDADYFSQESKLTEGRSKAVILFVNKPDHFEPGEMTYLGFSNDNQEFDLAESDTILFNVDYSSDTYRFYDGTMLGSLCKTTSPNVELYGQKKILKFKQLSGSMVKIPEGTSSTDAELKSDYFWKVPEDSVTKAKLSCPQKHLIKLVFEGNYLNEAIKENAGGSGTVTFYSDIVKEYPSDNTNKHITDCRIDSTDGESVPLDVPYEISKPTTFVFSGATGIPSAGTEWYDCIDSSGKNNSKWTSFSGNLSRYKVKYLCESANVKTVLLKSQMIRDYIGTYNWKQMDGWKPPLIMSNGKIALRIPDHLIDNTAMRPGAYAPYGNTDDNGNTWDSPDGTIVSSQENIHLRGVLDLFRDSCIERQIDDRCYLYVSSGYHCVGSEYTTPIFSNKIYGVSPPFNIYYGNEHDQRNGGLWAAKSLLEYWTSSNGILQIAEKQLGDWRYWENERIEDESESQEYVKIRISSTEQVDIDFGASLNIWRIQNTIDKTLLSTDFVDKETLDEAMEKNTGVCLYKLTESEVNEREIAISPGNYICFQGDGELHITVEPGGGEPPAQGLYLSNIKDSNHVTVVDHGSSLRPNRKVVYIDPQAISDDVDEDGNYHVDLMMNNVKLISAELTNRPHTKEDPKITITETSTTADDIVTESNGVKKTEPGDTTTTYQIIANDSRPIMVEVDKSMCKTRVKETEGSGTVTFYADIVKEYPSDSNKKKHITDCRIDSIDGELVQLDVPYEISKPTTFVFSGPTDYPKPNYGIYGTYCIVESSKNFRGNLSYYKLRYNLSNTSITNTDTKLRNQVIRDYLGGYGMYGDMVVLVMQNAKMANGHYARDLDESWGDSYGLRTYSPHGNISDDGTLWEAKKGYYDIQISSSENTDMRKVLDLFRDSCLVRQNDDVTSFYHNPGYLHTDTTEGFSSICYGLQLPCICYVSSGESTNPLTLFFSDDIGKSYICTETDFGVLPIECKIEDEPQQFSDSDVAGYLNIPKEDANYINETGYIKIYSPLNMSSFPGVYFRNAIDKTLLSTDFVDKETLDDAMKKNTGVCLYNLTESEVNERGIAISPGNYICFQGNGELHVTVEPGGGETKETDIYKGSYSYNTKSAYQNGDMNTPYKWYNTTTKTLKSTGNSWNYEVEHGSVSPVSSETFVLSPDTATYTRDKNGEYIYTITCVNAKISADFVDNTAKVYHFEKDQAPAGQRSVDFYKATEDHTKNLTFTQDNSGDIAVWARINTLSPSANNNIVAMYQQERLYPNVSHYNNRDYWNYSALLSPFSYHYCGDWSTKIGKIDSDYFASIYRVIDYKTTQVDTLVPGDIRFFSRVDRHTGAIHEFICDDWEDTTADARNIFKNPYGGFNTIKMSSCTYPKNYALDQFVAKHPECAPTNKYDQDEILRKLTGKCAADLKGKNSKTKVYVVKYRKQETTRPFPTYTNNNISSIEPSFVVESAPISCDYSYLDSCASGSDYIYECSTQAELETIMAKIAERIKQESGYTTAHCESVN